MQSEPNCFMYAEKIINILAGLLAKSDIQKIEAELQKVYPTNQTSFTLKSGYRSYNNSFSAGFEFRATFVQTPPAQYNITFTTYFQNVVDKLVQPDEIVTTLNDTLEKLLINQGNFKVKVYPALYLSDIENSIAFSFSIIKQN